MIKYQQTESGLYVYSHDVLVGDVLKIGNDVGFRLLIENGNGLVVARAPNLDGIKILIPIIVEDYIDLTDRNNAHRNKRVSSQAKKEASNLIKSIKETK